ncbi:MAG: DNA translocase FtsK, partial [Oscillospiraceae bacterium]|nr:DNA translocase FtsK [Oscillospiraceae bacterium]
LKVASSLESRIILDAGGAADKLEGNGDMLYAPIGSSRPVRLQGTWVTDDERESIVEFIKKQSQAQYEETVINEIDKAAEEKEKSGGSKAEDEPSSPMDDYDELLPQAVDVILESGQASVSMLQRRLKLGYSRAARIVDQMEELGIVGQFEGAKARQVKITREQWREMQYINGTAPVDILPEPDTFEDLREEAPDID